MTPLRVRAASLLAVALLGSSALGATGCGGDPPSRPEVLGELTGAGIVPAYERASDSAAELSGAAAQLCDGDPTDADLDAARGALAGVRADWLRTEAVWVGPVMENRSWALVDWPTDPEGVEEAIADAQVPISPEDLAKKVGADMRGLRTAEYLLWGGGADSFVDQRRCDYLVGITEVVDDEISAVAASWRGEGEPDGYPAAFVDEPGAVDEVVNDALELLQSMVDMELGAALGTGESEADPGAVVDGPAGLGTADLSDRLAGLSMLLVGDESQPGLSPLLGDELSGRLEQQLAEARAAIDAIPEPLSRAVVEDPDSVTEAREALAALRVTLASEVVSRLGVTVGFSDADGDSAG